MLIVTWVAVIWLVQGKKSAEDDLTETKESYASGPDAQAAAERILGEMISFDYRDIDDEYDWTKYLADDELRSDYEDHIVPKLGKVIRGRRRPPTARSSSPPTTPSTTTMSTSSRSSGRSSPTWTTRTA